MSLLHQLGRSRACVDVEVFEGGFQAVFEEFLLSSHRSFAVPQLVVQNLFRQWAFRHPDDVSSPSGLCFLLEGEDAGYVGSLKDLCVGNFVLPFDAEGSAEATQVEMVELSSVPAADCPGLSSVKGGKNHCMVDLQLGGQTEPSSHPHVLTESPVGSTGFGDFDFNVSVHRL